MCRWITDRITNITRFPSICKFDIYITIFLLQCFVELFDCGIFAEFMKMVIN